MSIISIMLADRAAIATLWEETLSDGSKVINITLGNMKVSCIDEYRAIRAFQEIEATLKNCVVEEIKTA